MVHKELKKLSRRELLEILVSQSREIDRLQKELKTANELLENREIAVKNAGSMAEAALQLNHVFQNADAAAQQYLESIQRMVQKEQEILRIIQEKERSLQQKPGNVREQQDLQETKVFSFHGGVKGEISR